MKKASLFSILTRRMLLACVVATLFGMPAFAAEGYKVNVTVDADKPLAAMSPMAVGVQTQLYDGNLITQDTAKMIRSGAITALRFPGGKVSGVYHWSTNKQTNWQGTEKPNFWIEAKNNFGNFVSLLDATGARTIITVNYGSNLTGTGGGEPAEAAAWVAYANGDPNDTKVIGKDSTGYDWKTVGYWATMRASQPLAVDDGFNFLRIYRPKPLHILYWEIGSEVFANGYYAVKHKEGGEVQDLHFRYSSNKGESEKIRNGNKSLGPVSYGASAVEFAKAMKNVDPNVKIGVVLVSPADAGDQDKFWINDWNSNVLKTAGRDIDFVVLHWMPVRLSASSGWKDQDVAELLKTPQEALPMTPALIEMIQKSCQPSIQMAITEFSLPTWGNINDPMVRGLFAADAFARFIEVGIVNADWLELHDGFLDAQNVPTPAYFGTLMSRILLMPHDVMVTTVSSKNILSAYAAKRADGSIAIMLINKDPKQAATINVTVKGMQVAKSGMRFDYGPSKPPTGTTVARAPINEVGNTFTITVPAYTVTAIKIPKAQ
jgi:alpha-L-arabinofuranosidase